MASQAGPGFESVGGPIFLHKSVRFRLTTQSSVHWLRDQAGAYLFVIYAAGWPTICAICEAIIRSREPSNGTVKTVMPFGSLCQEFNSF